jgi:two-component system OmpR family response regulator
MASTTDRFSQPSDFPRVCVASTPRDFHSETASTPTSARILGPRVMLIEDDREVATVLQLYLQRAGIHTESVRTGAEAVASLATMLPEVVLIDLELPDVDGSALIGWLRDQHDCGIIVVSGSGDEATRVRSLELGADDYVIKPPSLPELVARVRAVHRRVGERRMLASKHARKGPERATVGSFAVDLHARQVRDSLGKLVNLTAAEFAVLAALIEAKGEPVPRERLSEIALHRMGHSEDRGVDQLIFGLRQKLTTQDDRRRFIQSVRNAGYLLSDIHQEP